MSDPVVPPATVTAAREDRRIRCAVIEWEEGRARCRPVAMASEWMPVLRPGAAVELSWSVDTALLTVDAVVQGPPDGGVLELAVEGPVRSVQRRDRVRARCVYPCELVLPELDGTWTTLRSETVDLSATGLAVRLSRLLEVGSRLGVLLRIPDEAPALLAAQVASAVPDSGRVGLGFTSLLPGDADRIGALVARLLTTRAAR